MDHQPLQQEDVSPEITGPGFQPNTLTFAIFLKLAVRLLSKLNVKYVEVCSFLILFAL